MPSPDRHPTDAPHLLVRADATAAMGVGHAMRCLALAQEVLGGGGRVTLSGQLDVPWVENAYRTAGVHVVAPPHDPADLVALAVRLEADAALLDGYGIDAAYGSALQSAGLRVGAMVDAEFGAHQVADVYVDQNPGTRPRPVTPEQLALAGASYTLFRDDVLAARDRRAVAAAAVAVAVAVAPDDAPVRVLAVFGGTDPLRAAPVVAPLVVRAAAAAARDVDLTVVSPDPTLAGHLEAGFGLDPRVHVIPAVTDLAARAAEADLVVTASGSTVWELLCIGVPTAVVCVIDNQLPGYEYATTGDLVTGLGHLGALRTDPAARTVATDALTAILTDTTTRERRVTRGRELLDGRGRQRVADTLLG